MYQLISVGAASGGDAYLLLGGRKTALIDSGYSFSARQMTENIKAVLGSRPLDYVLLTHSHFDHASGSAMCRLVWPEVKVCAGQYAAGIFPKPSAKATMREMNQSAAHMCAMPYDEAAPTDLFADIVLRDGDVVDLEGLTLHVLEVPGHTKCSISYWCPEEKLLLGSETFGVPNDGVAPVMPGYIVGYQMSVDAIKRAAALGAEHYLLPHFGEIHGPAVKKFFDDALYWSVEVKNRVVEGHLAGKTDDELIQMYKDLFYTPRQATMQSETAFIANVRHKIPMLLRECL